MLKIIIAVNPARPWVGGNTAMTLPLSVGTASGCHISCGSQSYWQNVKLTLLYFA